MILTIKNIGTQQNPYYKIMEGKNEFCATKSFENALMIQSTFSINVEKRSTLKDIIDKIKELKKIDLSKDFTQYAEILFLRYIYCRIARDNGYSLEAIGFEINRDHSTIIHSLRKFEDYFETNRNFRELYYEIKNSMI